MGRVKTCYVTWAGLSYRTGDCPLLSHVKEKITGCIQNAKSRKSQHLQRLRATCLSSRSIDDNRLMGSTVGLESDSRGIVETAL